MAKRVSFSGEHLGLPEIAKHHQDLESSLRLYFSAASPRYPVRFNGYAATKVARELRERLKGRTAYRGKIAASDLVRAERDSR